MRSHPARTLRHRRLFNNQLPMTTATSQTSTHFPAFHPGKPYPYSATPFAPTTCIDPAPKISLPKNQKREAQPRPSFCLQPSDSVPSLRGALTSATPDYPFPTSQREAGPKSTNDYPATTSAHCCPPFPPK